MSVFKKICVGVLMLVAVQVQAQLSVPKILGHNMVLQRQQPAPVWGTATAGAEVIVSFNGQTKKTKAQAGGEWKLELDAMEANANPQSLKIQSGKQSIELKNILVGEVWLCSGQSNMEYAMRKLAKTTVPAGVTDWPVNEVANAHNPQIRIFLSERKKMKPAPAHTGWSIAEDSALRSFSAAGYFFAKTLQQELKVPVGVISAAIPGSRIEPWMPEEAFTAEPFFQQQTDSTHKIDGDPGKFYTTMIEPMIPFAVKGFLWYQGESNCFLNERLQYAYKMKALINYWRKQWGGGDKMPFYYVQVAPYAYSKVKDSLKSYTTESLPEFWEAQQLVLSLPNTGMIATTDLNSNIADLHPVNKWDVGKRLAYCALGKTYKTNITPMGPVFKNKKTEGNKIVLSFDYTGAGLISKDGNPIIGFTIAGSDGRFVPADAVIRDNKLYISSSGIQKPIAVRFCWNEGLRTNLYNKQGLPAMSFRTDNPLADKFNPD